MRTWARSDEREKLLVSLRAEVQESLRGLRLRDSEMTNLSGKRIRACVVAYSLGFNWFLVPWIEF